MLGDSWQVLCVQCGQIFSNLFDEVGILVMVMYQVLEYFGVWQVLIKLCFGVEIVFDLFLFGDLCMICFDCDVDNCVELLLKDNQIIEKVIKCEFLIWCVVVSGEIISLLYVVVCKVGLLLLVIVMMIDEIFKYDIDFFKDLQLGDCFSVVLDEIWCEGEKVDISKILVVIFILGGKIYSGFCFDCNGKFEYFDVSGWLLKKSFICMLILFVWLSFSFGVCKYLVLGKMCMYKGVDYVVCIGMLIMVVGDVCVQFVGMQCGYGNVVILDYGCGYIMLYGYMLCFGVIKIGQCVVQGMVIGYVGLIGLVIGLYLYYEFCVNGVYCNLLLVMMLLLELLQGSELVVFCVQIVLVLVCIQGMEKLIYVDVLLVLVVDKVVMVIVSVVKLVKFSCG